MLLLDEYVMEMPSFKKVLADEVITDQEIHEHAIRTASLLRRLEQMLSPDAKVVATEALCELAVLYTLERKQAAMIRP
jgi:hypothetical protein